MCRMNEVTRLVLISSPHLIILIVFPLLVAEIMLTENKESQPIFHDEKNKEGKGS